MKTKFLAAVCFSAFSLLAMTAEAAVPLVHRQLPPVLKNGKAFFPIGVFDLAHSRTSWKQRLGDVDPELYECGVNTAFFGTIGMPDNKNYPGIEHIKAAFKKREGDAKFAELALIVQFDVDIIADPNAQGKGSSARNYKPLSPESKKARQAFLQNALAELSRYPNIIGYSIDEPENTFNNYYQAHRKDSADLDKGIGVALSDYVGWLGNAVKKAHPGAKMIPILAWWGTYQHAGELYDVLIADQYPRSEDKSEFAAPLYEVSFDAARAVSAARAAGNGRTVIYMPPVFDQLNDKWNYATFAEQRYLFFAPVTRGAMGIVGWRLNRATQEHREKVVYPALRELARFQDFYLGEWHDDLVKSDHDTATAGYLKEFSVRDELLDDVDKGTTVTVEDFVPDVSYCLRKRADGEWMLLAVNNCREAIPVTFTLSVPVLPAKLTEALSGREMQFDGRVLKDNFAPFGVHVYRFSGK